MVSGSRAQGRLIDHRSNMWPVVVLGIITAVLAWVWFGSRGEKRGAESQGKERSEDTHLTSLQEEPESEDTQPGKTPVLSAGQASLSHHTPTQLSTTGRDEGSGQGKPLLDQNLVQDHKADRCHLTTPHKEGVGIRPDPQQSKTKTHHYTGVEEQVNQDLSPSGDELVGASEECHPSVGGQETQVTVEDLKPATVAQVTAEDLKPAQVTVEDLKPATVAQVTTEDLKPAKVAQVTVEDLKPAKVAQVTVEDLKPATEAQVTVENLKPAKVAQVTAEDLKPATVAQVTAEDLKPATVAQDTVEDLKPATVTEEKLVQTSKEHEFVVPDKVVAIGAETGLMHPDHVQDDGGTLVNGSEEHVQKDNGTVCLQGNVTNGNAPTVTMSPRQVNRSASENFDQCDHGKIESSEHSEMVLAFDQKPVATLENTACAQVNGPITNNVSTKSCHAEVAIAQESDVILTSPTVDKCVLLHSSSQEEESPDTKWSGSSDNSCFAAHSEAKLHDDPQRTKRVAAVQPIPQNVSLGFKVHYITDSDSQLIAVIGDHEKLGEWESYVPLSSDKDGNWSHSLTLPADANVEWKFVMVEKGKIQRWEECYNRHLRTAHEDLATQQWWGYP